MDLQERLGVSVCMCVCVWGGVAGKSGRKGNCGQDVPYKVRICFQLKKRK